MDIKTAARDKGFSRNLTAGLIAFICAAAIVISAIRMQAYTNYTFLAVSLFLFPLPIACGLLAGFISPRRAIIWAPMWGCVFSMFTITLASGQIRDAGAVATPWRLALIFFALVTTCVAGFAGRIAADRGFCRKAAAALALLCAAMGFMHHILISNAARAFERSVMPEVIAQFSRDYLQVPKNLAWKCTRRPSQDCYKLSANLKGKHLSILAAVDAPLILGANYHIRGGSARIQNHISARRYLSSIGFQERMLKSLATHSGEKLSWSAAVDTTGLTLTSTGAVDIAPLPEPIPNMSTRAASTNKSD